MLTFAIVVACILAYLTVGFLLADLSIRIWNAADNRSRRSFLLFPLAFFKQRVGEKNINLLSRMEFDEEAWSDDQEPGRGFYTIFMLVIWPLKLLFNLPLILVLCLFVNLSRVLGTTRSNIVYGTYATKDVRAMFKERRAIIAEIGLLKAAKEELDKKIVACKSDGAKTFKYEEELDEAVRNAKLD